jgi:hypothetical protein
MISANYESFTLTLNLTTFYTFAAVLSLLGFARSIMQTIHYLSERGEAACVLQTQAA